MNTTARVLLHIGTPKSGTTYLQDLMWDHRGTLADAGVLYPGDRPDAHFLASQDLQFGEYQGWQDPEVDGAWARLVQAAREHRGTTVISHELFGDLTEEWAARALADLDFAEVHLVVTARDLARQLPAVWQEDLKHRHHLSLRDLVEVVRPGTDRPDVMRPGGMTPEGHAETFWQRQDLGAVLRRWGAQDLPADRVHVVTVPQPGSAPDLLWQRFASVIGIDPAVLPGGARPRNRSLGHVEAELLRRVNERLAYGVDWPVYGPRVTHLLAPVLADRAAAVPLRLPAGAEWVPAHAERMIAEVRSLGVSVVGDLDDLLVTTDGPAPEPEPGPAELLEAAMDAIVALLPGVAPVREAVRVEPEVPFEPAVPEVQAPPAPAGWPSWRTWVRAGRGRPARATTVAEPELAGV
ncbi:hypothetical protein JD79_02069 [Geodermatophilus normandii]|uniref:Sulfotransferase family protein n=1 Tax=Geodermatophilus normandii TaxID=1137989 RepID=A0A317QJM3_9ACTN|nr:hypothetical protein [Geodermatophilus normandii]PWW22906.1 hypothetical protein JD79_02069 [Geodermatophilus normandii]